MQRGYERLLLKKKKKVEEIEERSDEMANQDGNNEDNEVDIMGLHHRPLEPAKSYLN